LKKLLSVFFTVIFLLLFVTGVQAVTWDIAAPLYPNPIGNYSIPTYQNGAYFTYSSSYFNLNNFGAGDTSNNSDLNVGSIPAVDETVENFGVNPGSITFSAMAGGGVLSDGLYSAGSAEITHSGLTEMNGVSSGYQYMLSTTYRNFLPDGYGTIMVAADLTGTIVWDVHNYDPSYGPIIYDDPYSGYVLQGNVTITAHDAVQNNQVGDAHTISLDNNTLSGNLQFDPVADPDVYYVMNVSLLIITELQNADPNNGAFFNNAGEIPEPLYIGTALDPLELTAVVSQNQVPIPPSLILLLSGVGGLVAIRRRITGV